jgi:hypothetical protein
MQQIFDSEHYTAEDFQTWDESGELVLQPKFQRRDVWSDMARSYLIDTIVRGKPIPKFYMRLVINPKTKRVVREVVDGQQRIRSVLFFLKDGFKLRKVHNKEHGGKYFSGIDSDAQQSILNYIFIVDVLHDMPDEDIHDIFARLNTYSTTLNHQELRHAKYFGDFRMASYQLAYEAMPFWQQNNIFTDKQILRMQEAQFVSELLLAMVEGISAGDKRVIDNAYRDYDQQLPQRATLEKRFTQTIDTIGTILGESLQETIFKAARMLYPLYCAIYHMQFGLPEMKNHRKHFKSSDYQKVRTALEDVDDIFTKVKIAQEEAKDLGTKISEISDPLSRQEREFYEAYDKHWVHAKNRKILTDYICKLIVKKLH